MARNVSAAMEEAARGTTTSRVYSTVAQFDHPTLPAPIRLTDNSVPVTLAIDGRVFTPFRIEIQLPDDEEESEAIARLSLSSVALDRTIVNAIRGADDPPITVELKIVDATDPDAAVIEVDPLPFTWRGIEWSATQLSGQLRMAEQFFEEAFPGLSFTPSDGFPQATNQ